MSGVAMSLCSIDLKPSVRGNGSLTESQGWKGVARVSVWAFGEESRAIPKTRTQDESREEEVDLQMRITQVR